MPLGPRQTLLNHAQRLHSLSPGSPLPRDGEPYPDDALHRGRNRPRPPEDRSLVGIAAARILADHFADPSAVPGNLLDSFHSTSVSFYLNEYISAVVARALERLDGGTTALLWLAERVEGWGRVYVVEALCRLDDPAAKPWLLRRAVNGEFLNGYVAGEVAVKTALHEAIADPAADDELIDHAGRLMHVLADYGEMSTRIEEYAHAADVLEQHVRHLGTQPPTARRFAVATMLADQIHSPAADRLRLPPARLGRLRDAYGARPRRLVRRDAPRRPRQRRRRPASGLPALAGHRSRSTAGPLGIPRHGRLQLARWSRVIPHRISTRPPLGAHIGAPASGAWSG